MQTTTDKQHALELLDRLDPGQFAAVIRLLDTMADPVSRAIANAPLDDEPESDAERQAVNEAKQWLEKNPEGISFEDVLADYGLTLADVKNRPGK